MGYHPKRTIIEAANSGYLKGFPGLTAAKISKYVAVEDATEMGHMNKKQQVNHQKFKTRQNIKADTRIRYGSSHSRCNLCTNTRARQQKNALGFYVSEES